MTLRNPVRFVLLMAACVLAAGCSHKSSMEPWVLSTDPVVFNDTFGAQLTWQAFGNSKLDALSLDTAEKHSGTTSLKFVVPAAGPYAGGAITVTGINRRRNLSGYNAITFWAKANRAVALDVAGFGNDNTGTSKYTAQRAGISLTTEWTQFWIPVPSAARLAAEGGMFFLSEAPKNAAALSFWIDDVEFVNLATISNKVPTLTTSTLNGVAGSPLSLDGLTRTVFTVTGLPVTVTHSPAYFDFVSSDSTIALPVTGGVQVVGNGTATITAKLNGITATGAITVNATAPPVTAAPTPTLPASDVISMFSNAYPNVTVDTWSANWNQPGGAPVATDISIAGNTTKRYTGLNYAGIDFSAHPIDATAMTAFHLDVWAPLGATFLVKLVEYTSSGALSSQSELTFNAASTPAFTSGEWMPLEIPLANFTGLTSRSHLSQLVISSPDVKIVYVDNVYFHQ
jgi:hypothetical protein